MICRRVISSLGLASFCVLVHADYGLGRSFSAAIRSAVQEGFISQEALQAKSDTEFPIVSQEPLPAAKAGEGKFVLLHADRSEEASNRDFIADGGVHFLYRGYDIHCDQVHGNFDSKIFLLEGNVDVLGASQAVQGERIIVNFADKTLRYEQGRARLDPAFTKGKIRGPLYLTGNSLSGGNGHYYADQITITPCDLPKPHFELNSRSIDLIPGKRVILRDSRLRILNKPILTIPYLVLPLNETGERVLPKVGHSRDEGYYILNRIATPLRGETYLNNRLDYFSKLGAGIGSDLHYSQGSMYGLARVYGIVGSVRSKLASIDHRMPLLGGKFALESVFQSSNYLTAPNTRTLIARSNFTRNTKQGNFRFTFNQNSSKSSNYDTLSSSFALSDQRTWSPRTRTDLDLNYATSQSSGFNNQGVKSKRLDLRFRGTEDLTKAELELLYQRAIPIGTQANFYAGSDQTPMLSLKSDARRMFGDRFSQQLPFTMGVSVAELRDNQAKRLTRSAFDWAMYKNNSAKNGSSFTYNARFKQGIYSDNTAQYVLALDGGYRYQIAPKSYFNWRHTYLQPEGFTPLNIDQSGKSNQSYLEIMTETRGGFRFGAQSGYDFRAADRKSVPWQSASLRLDYEPSKRFYLRTNSSYDTSRAKWQNIRLDSGIRVGEGFVTLGTRFDGDRHIWGNVNLYAEGLRFGKLKMSALASYNGYLKQFDSRHVSLIYDLHDAEAILQIIDNPTGFRKGTEIGFFIRLKVLPFDTPFGIGRRGQAIGSGTGHDF